MGLGTSFAFMYFGMISSKMDPEEGSKFMLQVAGLSKISQIGLVLLFVSGGALMTPYWSSLGDNMILTTKLVLFLVLGGLLGMISANVRKAKNGQIEKLQKLKTFGPMALITGITIVILAVLNFH